MSRSSATPTPTTTYPYTYTTFSTSHAPSTFTRPTIVPSFFSFGPALSCASNSQATPQPSQFPLGRPSGTPQGACVISNAREVNDHAFWDLYECCKGKDMTAFGTPMPCTAQCRASDGQTFLELGECLSKKVNVVICSPPQAEIGRNDTSSTTVRSSGSGSASGSPTGSASQASGSTGAANVVGVVQTKGTKTAVVVFAVLALGSAVGMFL